MQEGRSVPRDELAEAIWGEELPATWEKALRVLMTKLRRLLEECGIDRSTGLTSAFGCYTLALPPDTWIDVRAAARALEQAETALTAGDPDDARAQAATAATLSRPTFLPGEEGPWVAEQRRDLRDVHLRALECLRDASLAGGEFGEAVRSATEITELEPFRESNYRALMQAHIAAGNRAEALQVYERCRLFLADELGAYPSPETELIYRDLLEAPVGRPGAVVSTEAGDVPESRGLAGRRPPLVGAVFVGVAVVAVAAVIALVATRGVGAGTPSTAGIALVVPRLQLGSDDSSVREYEAALERARGDDVDTATFAIDPAKPLPQRVRRSIGSFGLVLLAGPLVSSRFVHVIAQHRHTRFVVLDPPNSANATPLDRAVTKNANATDVFFATGPTAYLAGYLSASMGQRTDPGKHQAVVSIIVSDPALNANELEGFIEGVAGAGRGTVDLISKQTHDASDPAVCERIANDQIDKGSTTVYADAGPCSAGALAAAAERGVWAIASDPSARGPEILGSTVKRLGRAADSVITSYLEGALPRGHFDIGIERNAIAFVDINRGVPARIRAKLARVTQEHIDVWKTYATPQK